MNASYTQQSAPKVTFDRNPDLEYESFSVMNTAESEIRRLHPHKPCSESSLCILKSCIDSLNSQAHIQTRKIRLKICEYSAFREPLGCSVPQLEFIGFCVYLFIYLDEKKKRKKDLQNFSAVLVAVFSLIYLGEFLRNRTTCRWNHGSLHQTA